MAACGPHADLVSQDDMTRGRDTKGLETPGSGAPATRRQYAQQEHPEASCFFCPSSLEGRDGREKDLNTSGLNSYGLQQRGLMVWCTDFDLFFACIAAMAAAVAYLLAGGEWSSLGWFPRGHGGQAHVFDTDVNLRRIMTNTGVIDTTRTPGLQGCLLGAGIDGMDRQVWGNGPTRRQWGQQWYVQTRGLLTATQRAELEVDAGLKLGPYFPNSAHLIIATRNEACRVAEARHVRWVGQREANHKFDKSILTLNQTMIDLAEGRTGEENGAFLKGSAIIPAALNVALWPHLRRNSSKHTATIIAEQIAHGIMSEFSINASVRAPAMDKLVVEATFGSARPIAEWLARDPYVVGVERKTMFATRNDASNRILVAGPSTIAKALDSTPLERAGLNGNGITIGVADTGLDHDHCLLWQRPFDWFCFDPYDVSFDGMRKCPFSAYAGLLENADFESFLDMMINTAKDVPLMSSGRTKLASNKVAPMDITFPDRGVRQVLGYLFSLANDTSIPRLLKAWRKVRQPLIQILTRKELCIDCGGTIRIEQGVTVFEARMPFVFSKEDKTWDVVNETLGEEWSVFEKIMTEKCFCFWTVPSVVTVNQIEAWQGPIPVVKQLLTMSTTPTASILRKGAGLPALPTAMLQGLCDATRGGGDFEVPSEERDSDGVRQGICRNVTFDFESANETLNPCELHWEPRAIESAISRCIAAEYLKVPKQTKDAFKDNSQTYTYNTTLEWWKEYTILPPFNFMDFSRRRVNAYYTYDGCESCGMCARLRLDSRNYKNIEVSSQLPATLVQNDIFFMSLKTTDNDWRLDAFEARNVGFSVELETTVISNSPSPIFTTDIGTLVGFCMLTEGQYSSVQTLRDRPFWARNCINVGGLVFGSGQKVNATKQKQFEASREPSVGRTQYDRMERISQLPRSADGWRIVVWNNGTSDVTVNVVARFFTLPIDCSDKKDGKIGLSENTHSLDLGNANLRSMAPNNKCVEYKRTYCDNSYDSGRQLDACLVCGGNCFAPDCSKEHCFGHEDNTDFVRIRFLGEFPEDIVSKIFTLPQLSAPNMSCPSPTDPNIRCKGDDCDYLERCKLRVETYEVDTRSLHVKAGVPHVFEPGRLRFETNGQSRMVKMRVLALTDPTWHLRTKTFLNGVQGGGRVQFSRRFPRIRLGEQDILVFRAMNLTDANVKERSMTEIQVVMNETYIQDFLDGLIFTASFDSGTNLDNRQRLLRIQIQFLQPNMQPWPVAPGKNGYAGGFGEGGCKAGFAGEACDTIFPPFELRVTVEPADKGQRVVRPDDAEGKGGRKRLLSRDGHGTHVVTSIIGKALDPIVGKISAAMDFDGLARGAYLAFVDIAKSGNPYLTPPESLGDALFERPYTEGNARIFLNPWTCEDYVWWKKQDEPFQSEQEVASSFPLNQMSNICNRYGTDAWEVDEFVTRHLDLLVIFPAGDNGVGGLHTVSSPGTCKNCLTVGTSQSWPDALEASIPFQPSQCRPEDCPQDFDKTETCADPKITSPYVLPACCSKKYKDPTYGPGSVDPRSSRGNAVSEQAPFDIFGGNTYKDLDALQFGRIKPDIVAPGINIVSGRSDGDPLSNGFNGVRCGMSNDGEIKDSACLTTLSGSSMAAAKATAVAALVRQYFADGFYPGGLQGFSPKFEPSAALVKAVILASTDEMQRAVKLDGSMENIETMPVPNLFYGFGRPRLMNVLRVTGVQSKEATVEDTGNVEQAGTVDPMKVCNCSRNNSLLFAKGLFSDPRLRDPGKLKAAIEADPNGVRFGGDYGMMCAPWNAMRDGRRQQCDTIFGDNPASRQAPSGVAFDANVLDETCCFAWCFVDETCPYAQKWDQVPGLYYSTDICQQDQAYQQQCPFKDVSLTRDIKTAVFDHSMMSLNTYQNEYGNESLSCNVYPAPDDCQYVEFKEQLAPERGAIAQGEEMKYTLRIKGATRQHPLVVAMAYTDPMGVVGAPTVLVNDLDLRVRFTPLLGDGWAGSGENRTFSTDNLQKDANVSTVFYGNTVTGGDTGNNAEVVRINSAGPAELIVTVFARRIADSLPGSDGLCQPFGLVITGQIDLDLLEQPVSFRTEPVELELGICGRSPKMPPPPQKGLKLWQIILIAVGAMVGAVLLIFTCYKFVYRWAFEKVRRRTNNAHPDLVGYLSKLEKANEEEGMARGGAHDFIILAENASKVDEFYQGLPIAITAGLGEGESGIISSYNGRSRRAEVEFESNVGRGSQYAISHDKGLGMGYKIGQAGYMPVGHLPQPDEEMGDLYAKQFVALTHARNTHGNLSADELSAKGIGKTKRVLTKREQVQLLRAGVFVGTAISSGDLYSTAVTKSGQNLDGEEGGTDSQKLVEYTMQVKLDIVKDQASQGYTNAQGLKGRNAHSLSRGSQSRTAPPLRSQPNAGTGFKVPGFTSSKRNRTGLSKISENLKSSKTWEAEELAEAAFGNPPCEPSSTTNLVLGNVVATLTTPRPPASAAALPHRGISNGGAHLDMARDGSTSDSSSSNSHTTGRSVQEKKKDTKKLASMAFD